MTDQSNGELVTKQMGMPYGTQQPLGAFGGDNSWQHATKNNPSKKRFTSYDRSDATGLDYAVNRYYNAAQGRFTQVDPIGMSAASLGDPQSLNLYAYCGNDPVNHTDPDGLFFKKLFKWIGKAIRFLFKAATVGLVIIAAVVAPHVAALLILGLAGLTGLAGWHNGKLGQITGSILTAGLGAGGYNSLRTPPTFGGAGTGAVTRFATQEPGDGLPKAPPLITPQILVQGAAAIALNEAVINLNQALKDASSALDNPECRKLIAGRYGRDPRSLLSNYLKTNTKPRM